MAIETERIDLGNGQWWEIRTRLTRGMEKAVNRVTMASMPAIRIDGTPDPEQIKAQLIAQMGQIDTGAIEDIYLLRGTVRYSFGETVDLDVIDTLDAAIVRRVYNRMMELYSPQRLSEVQRDGFFATPSNAS